jgi:hypothetical protein
MEIQANSTDFTRHGAGRNQRRAGAERGGSWRLFLAQKTFALVARLAAELYRPAGRALPFTHKYPWTKERERKPYNFVLSEPQIAEYRGPNHEVRHFRWYSCLRTFAFHEELI